MLGHVALWKMWWGDLDLGGHCPRVTLDYTVQQESTGDCDFYIMASVTIYYGWNVKCKSRWLLSLAVSQALQ